MKTSDIEVVQGTFNIINSKCNTQYSFDKEFLSEVDFHLRFKTGYSYEEFIKYINKKSEMDEGSERMAVEIFNDIGCNTEKLNTWADYVVHTTNTEYLDFYRQPNTLFGLPKLKRDVSFVSKMYTDKLNIADQLSYEELKELAFATEIGYYRYSMGSTEFEFDADRDKAIKLWEQIVSKFDNGDGYYWYAKTLEKRSKDEALEAYMSSAERGFEMGKVWLGTYYACNKKKELAIRLLAEAKNGSNNPEYIEDLFAEIKELGMPTNCMDGWVY